MVNHVNDTLTDTLTWNAVNKKAIPENKIKIK